MAPLVWSYGGGVQSVTLAVLILQGRLPVPSVAVLADTGREIQTTFNYMAERVNPALLPLGLQIEIASHDLATVDLYSKGGKLLMPVYTSHAGSLGRLPTYCSNEWKKRVVSRYLRHLGIRNHTLWLGISTDEAHRMKPSGTRQVTHAYPLIDLGMSRKDCIRTIKEYGWPLPSKSRCFMCPHMTQTDWRNLPDSEVAKAVALDETLRQHDPDVYLHRSGKPLREAMNDADEQAELFDGCDSGFCWT